jgi:hypothetical protein
MRTKLQCNGSRTADAQRLRAGVGEDHLGELETKRRMRSNGVRPVVKVLFRARAAN